MCLVYHERISIVPKRRDAARDFPSVFRNSAVMPKMDPRKRLRKIIFLGDHPAARRR